MANIGDTTAADDTNVTTNSGGGGNDDDGIGIGIFLIQRYSVLHNNILAALCNAAQEPG
jgi:hypothetical protein